MMTTHSSSFSIDAEVQREYDENGAVCLRQVFDQFWVDKVAKGISKNLSSPSAYGESLKAEGGDGVYFDDYLNWTRIEEFHDFVWKSPAAQIAGTVMKSQFAAFYHDHVLTKEPGTAKKTPWHQDQSYYPFDGFKVCSIWMPVDPIPLDTSLKFIKGSHKWGRWFTPIKFETEKEYSAEKLDELKERFEAVPDIEANPDEYQVLCWALKPGDCVVFHMSTLHGAAGNLSTTNHRRILSTRWLGDDAVYANRPWITSPPINGGLKDGEPPYKSSSFPVVWRSNSILA